MPGLVSWGEYAILWIGGIVCVLIGVVAAVVGLFKKKD